MNNHRVPSRLAAAIAQALSPHRVNSKLTVGAVLGLAALGAIAAEPKSGVEPAQNDPAAETTLPKLRVEAEIDEGYRRGVTTIGKFEQAPIDVPQSLTVVPNQLFEDRNADSLREALRNVAGLTFNAGEGGRIGDNITLRGYSIVGDLYLDGLRDIAQYNREVFNLEQIDVLRGSTSMLFGRGSTGGVINQVSKQPFVGARNTLSLTGGSNEYLRGTADINQTFGESSAARINAMYTDTDSFRDGPQYERWGIAPTVSFGIGTGREFSLAYYHLEDDNVPDMGVPYFNGHPLDVPVERFYGLSDTDNESNETGIATASYRQELNDALEFRAVLRSADYSRHLWASAPRLAAGTVTVDDNTVVNRGRQARGSKEDTWTSQTGLIGHGRSGSIEHTFLTGLELIDEEARRWNYTSTVPNPPATVGNPNNHPQLPPQYFGTVTQTNFVSYAARTVGVYAQDILSLTDHWQFLAGVRYDDFTADYDRPDPQGDLERTDGVWSWRSGLMYRPQETSSYYVSYGTSFNPSAELYALDDRSVNTPPEKSRNIEIGAKWDLLDGELSVRTALARSQKTHERNTDLSIPDLFLLSGKRHTDSLEFEVAGRLTPDWEIFGGVAFMDGEIDAASGQQANTQGNVPINTPDYTMNLWTAYHLGRGWKAGAGVEGADLRYGNAANVNAAPSYVRWDALIEYESMSYAVHLNVFNLLDEEYYEGVYSGHIIPGTTRTAQLQVDWKF